MKSALNCIIFLLLISIFSDGFSQKQAPGYLGRKFELSYNLSIAPAMSIEPELRNFSGTKVGLYEGEPYFLSRHDVGVFRTFSRRSSIGLLLSGLRIGWNSSAYHFAVNQMNTFGQVKAGGLGIAHRWYPFHNRGSIAPVGPFTQIQYTIYQLRLFNPAAAETNPIETRGIGVFGFAFGSNNALTDRLLLSYGVEMNVLLLNYFFQSEGDCCNRSPMRDAMFYHNFLKFRLGISGLFF